MRDTETKNNGKEVYSVEPNKLKELAERKQLNILDAARIFALNWNVIKINAISGYCVTVVDFSYHRGGV